MANHEIKSPPEFVQGIRKFEITDKGHANLFNDVVNPLINNDVFLKQALLEESTRAEKTEETNKNNLSAHVADKANPHKVTKAQVGLGDVNNTADVNKPVSTAQQNAIDSAYQQATGYTDQKIADLIGGAPETLDTLKEVAEAIEENADVVEALDEAIGKKANQTDLTNHINDDGRHNKVTQQNTSANADIRLLLSGNANDTNETNYVKKSNQFLANPSTGEFYARGYRRIDITGKTLDVNTLNLGSGAPNIMQYIEKTDGGCANITNIPVTGKPFLLDVEIIRWASTTDYITMQIFRSAVDYTHEYVRICNSGTWTAWKKAVSGDDVMTAATSNGAGTAGLVPAPPAGSQNYFLCGDGTWKEAIQSKISKTVYVSYGSNNGYSSVYGSFSTEDIGKTGLFNVRLTHGYAGLTYAELIILIQSSPRGFIIKIANVLSGVSSFSVSSADEGKGYYSLNDDKKSMSLGFATSDSSLQSTTRIYVTEL